MASYGFYSWAHVRRNLPSILVSLFEGADRESLFFKDLNYVDIDPLFREHDLTKWSSLLCDQLDGTDVKQDIQQQLLHERQRLSSTKGVTTYLVTENRILYQSHGRFNYTDNHLGQSGKLFFD